MILSRSVIAFCNIKSLQLIKRPILTTKKCSNYVKIPSVSEYLKIIELDQEVLGQDSLLIQLINERTTIKNEVLALKELKEIDTDMKKLIEEEKEQYSLKIEQLNNEIIEQLTPQFEENRDVVVEVTAGVGGKEAMHFAGEIWNMYAKFSLYKGWVWEEQEYESPESGGIRHGRAYVSGKGVISRLLQESGVHRVQRIPATERTGRVHTSTVAVAVLPQPTDLEVVINDRDIKIETKTSSGPGGQHVNKNETCVRITHLPTGIVIENQTDRSQVRNKKLAMQRLRSKLYQMNLEGFQSKVQSSRKEQKGLSLRSDKIRTYNFNQDRVTDHRVGLTLHNLAGFLSGGAELDDLMTKLLEYNREKELLRFVEERLAELSKRQKN